MTDILDAQVDVLLRKAEQRLRDGPATSADLVPTAARGVKPDTVKVVQQQPASDSSSSSKKNDLSVRAPPQPQAGLKSKEKTTAGANWFDLPKTVLTPEFKRDWQLLRMRGILDPKHQKKALRASAPEYSQVGEIIAGPTEFYSARLTRKERKATMMEEVMSTYDKDKFTTKYAGIQKQKTSGKKAFYKKLVAQRRKRRSAVDRSPNEGLTVRLPSLNRCSSNRNLAFSESTLTHTYRAKPGDLVPNKIENQTPVEPRYPRSLEALHLKPLKREAEHGIPSCDLQLRSYSVQPLEFFSDFALRAAYYLGLPAYGPVPLPRITERWTVPRSNFIFKKSQENFERKTLRRLIQIRDGNPETVQIWLAYLRKHQYYGVGMKANVWEFSELGVGKKMDALPEADQGQIEAKWAHLGQTKTIGTVEKVEELLSQRRFREAAGLRVPPTTES
ncbi:30S ribosomal protein S10 [Fusarium sp. LHS14.1]|nr:30S ribosomal protein S10 [Fusarium sp. LHS14.1]